MLDFAGLTALGTFLFSFGVLVGWAIRASISRGRRHYWRH